MLTTIVHSNEPRDRFIRLRQTHKLQCLECRASLTHTLSPLSNTRTLAQRLASSNGDSNSDTHSPVERGASESSDSTDTRTNVHAHSNRATHTTALAAKQKINNAEPQQKRARREHFGLVNVVNGSCEQQILNQTVSPLCVTHSLTFVCAQQLNSSTAQPVHNHLLQHNFQVNF